MARSQRALRARKGFDSSGDTAYTFGDRTDRNLTSNEQYTAARASGFFPPLPAGTALPVNTVIPTVTGTATVGQTLTGGNGTWTGTPAPTLTRQWRRGTTDIPGATGATYVIQVADQGSQIRLAVTGNSGLGPPIVGLSNPTATVP